MTNSQLVEVINREDDTDLAETAFQRGPSIMRDVASLTRLISGDSLKRFTDLASRFGSSASMEIVAGIKDGSSVDHSRYCSSLLYGAGPEGMPKIIGGWSGYNASQKSVCIEVAAMMSEGAFSSTTQSSVDKIIEMGLYDPSSVIRDQTVAMSAKVISRRPDIVTALISKRDPELCSIGIRAAVHAQRDLLKAQLHSLLADQNEAVQLSAISAVKEMRATAFCPDLLRLGKGAGQVGAQARKVSANLGCK